MVLTNNYLVMVLCTYDYYNRVKHENEGKASVSTFLRFSCFLNEANGLSLIERCVEFVLTIATRARA